MSKIIGIDLGTTNSCVSVMEGSEPVVIPNAEGKRTTPSVIAFVEGGEIKVGDPAKRQAVTNPTKTVYSVKRFMGNKFSELKKEKDRVPYKVVKGDNDTPRVDIDGRLYTPQELSAMILQKMKKTAEDYLGTNVEEAVITVPAYFNDSQRQATKAAGKIAGLEVKRIINEPTAAALAFGLDKLKKDGVIAVYDLGGGTFDISIIEMTNVDGEYQFEVLSTSGDTHLGGEDFDSILMNHFIGEFKNESGFDLNTDPMALQRLKEAAEKAKIELSTTEQTEVNLPYITADASGPKHFVHKITRAKLESLVGDLVKRSLEPLKTALKDAKFSPKDIDEVILVGGQTRMPMVQKAVTEFFGKEARKDINPDEAVALGAATQGAVLSGDRSDVLLLDVTPLTLGIETLGGVLTPMIEKNTTIPTNKSQVYSTAEDNQTAVTVHVLQGERKKASDNKSLGQFNLTDIPAAPRGTPQIEVTFDIDANGIINVSAKDKSTNVEQSITIQGGSGLSDEEIEKMVKDAELNAEEDKKFEELIASRNMADGLASSTKKAMEENKDELTEDESKSLGEAISNVEEACKSESKEDIDKAVEELSKIAQPLSDKLFKKEAPEQTTEESSDNKPEDAVDAEFKEVDDEKDK